MSQNDTILIVEDNEMSLKMAKSLLQLAGYSILEANNAEMGINLAKEHLPNLILMDMHLPIKSGYEASQELKAIPETESIPIVAFTALAMEEEQKRALAHGCTGVISKPIDIKNFAQVVESFLKRRKSSFIQAPIQTGQLLTDQTIQTQNINTCVHCIEKVERTKQDLEEFLSTASHDLQGPLRKIQQFARLLEQPSSEEAQVYIQGISRSAKEMEALLKGLLTLSRVNQKTDPVINISLTDVLRQALSRYQNEIGILGAQVEVRELTHLQADFQQMQFVFEELLGNALKFHQKGKTPVISIKGAFLTDTLYEITFQDNGIGFEEEYAERIFRPFQRLNSFNRYDGKGMGLAIVKKIIERHRGIVRAKSAPGQGVIFNIRLPLKID